jgi:hypothetical protein
MGCLKAGALLQAERLSAGEIVKILNSTLFDFAKRGSIKRFAGDFYLVFSALN